MLNNYNSWLIPLREDGFSVCGVGDGVTLSAAVGDNTNTVVDCVVVVTVVVTTSVVGGLSCATTTKSWHRHK